MPDISPNRERVFIPDSQPQARIRVKPASTSQRAKMIGEIRAAEETNNPRI